MVWLYSFLMGIFCTVLINPMFYKRCIFALLYKKKSESWLRANADKSVSLYNLPKDIKRFNVEGKWEYETLWGGFIAETIWFLIGFCYARIIIFGFFAIDLTFLAVLYCMWLPTVLKLLYTVINHCIIVEYDEWVAICPAVAFAISFILIISSGIYDNNNQKELSSVIVEPDVPVISVDISKTLDNLQISDKYDKLEPPVYRNGEIIYVLKNGDSSSESAGYISVKGEEVKFVKFKLKYTPYTESTNAVKYKVREAIPNKIVFGDYSLQKAEDGTIYFAFLYGHHTFLRGGKELEGMVYVNAETGETYTCSLEDIPSFITGITE